MTIAPLGLFVLSCVVPTFSLFGFKGFGIQFSIPVSVCLVVLAVPGAVLWMAGRTVDDFSKDPH
jgi:hypothetical protein